MPDNRTINAAFLDSAERLIREFGLLKIAGAIGAVVTVLVGVGVLNDAVLVGYGVAFGLIATFFLLLISQFIDRRRLNKEMSSQKRILTNYTRSIDQLQDHSYFDIVDWDESIVVLKNGDAKIVRKFKLRVGSRHMSAFWTSAFLDPAPDSSSYQKKVRLKTGHLEEDGSMGTDLLRTHRWDGHRITCYVHFDEHKIPGSELGVYVELFWPEYFGLLDQGEVVPNNYLFRRHVEKFRMKVTLSRSFLGQRVVVTRPLSDKGQLATSRTLDGEEVVSFQVDSPGFGERMGFDIQLRPSGPE